MPKDQPGTRRVDDRRMISGLIHMVKCSGRWAYCPPEYGLSTTVYNLWNRWNRWGISARILAALTEEGWIAETSQIDSSYIKACRSACGAKGGGARANAIWWQDNEDPRPCRCPQATTPPCRDAGQYFGCQRGRPADRRDYQHEAGDRRPWLRRKPHRGRLARPGHNPVIPGRHNRKRPIQYNKRRYKDRWRV